MVEIADVDIHQIVELRRRVLRANDESAQVIVASDHEKGCFHLGITEDDCVVACVSAFALPCPDVASPNSWQFRFMAVDASHQGHGLGRALMTRLLAELRGRGADVAWANGRDTAQGFYEAMGFTIVEGSAHLSPETGLPHHRIYVAVTTEGETVHG